MNNNAHNGETSVTLAGQSLQHKFDGFLAYSHSAPYVLLDLYDVSKPCLRQTWYKYHWVNPQTRTTQELLFNHAKIWQLCALLKKQFGLKLTKEPRGDSPATFSHPMEGWVRGRMQGTALGVPEAPQEEHVLLIEFIEPDTWEMLRTNKLEVYRPDLYRGLHLIMYHLSLDCALFIGVNKHTNALYAERIAYNKQIAFGVINIAWFIIHKSNEPFARISDDVRDENCQQCAYKKECHKQAIPQANCRTCMFGVQDKATQWYCKHHQRDIPSVEAQQVGCPYHLYRPKLLPGIADGYNRKDHSVNYTFNEVRYTNAFSKGYNRYPSAELQHLDPALIGDEGIETIREDFDGEVVGTSNN